ncbi:MAG: hypothetical protein KAK04_24055, partial [Cyclobacteriaceae bacterium]|nr:hypothetical protein [Cyclobacteriaceae bacterium]
TLETPANIVGFFYEKKCLVYYQLVGKVKKLTLNRYDFLSLLFVVFTFIYKNNIKIIDRAA